jgi:hypothetical protein
MFTSISARVVGLTYTAGSSREHSIEDKVRGIGMCGFGVLPLRTYYP